MQVGDLVRHKLSERGMTGVIITVDELLGEYVGLWDDGRQSVTVSNYLVRVPNGHLVFDAAG